MRRRLPYVAPIFLLAACSGSAVVSSSSADPNAAGEGNDDGGSTTNPAAGRWEEIPIEAPFEPAAAFGDSKGIWLSKATPDDGTGNVTVSLGELAHDGTFTEAEQVTDSKILFGTIITRSLATLAPHRAVVAKGLSVELVGQTAPRVIDHEIQEEAVSVAARGETDVWSGSPSGAFMHWDGANAKAYFGLDDFIVQGLYATGSFLFAVSDTAGVRSIAIPIGDPWNGETHEEIRGSFSAISGRADDDVFAVGRGGAIVHWNGKAWSPVASGTTEWLASVAAHAANDVWVTGESSFFHYDGKAWSSVDEPGMPKVDPTVARLGNVAVEADGTLWTVANKKLYRRSPGAVKGMPTTATVDSGVTTGCNVGEPNDTKETAAQEPPTFHVEACFATASDLDDYVIVPTGNAGGFAEITVTDTGGIHPFLQVDDSESISFRDPATLGQTKHLYVPLLPAAKRTIALAAETSFDYAPATSNTYTLDVKYTAFADAFEPNNTSGAAPLVASNTALSAYLPSGAYAHNDGGPTIYPDTADWYRVSVPKGAFTVSVTSVPGDAQIRLSVKRDINGTLQDFGGVTGGLGASVTLPGNLNVNGGDDLYVEVEDLATHTYDGAAPPASLTQPYTLMVAH